ncbi:uncharacterized protein LOC114129617 [Aphis gossypii]|uniref:Uncharacterized protein n=1 Tax=Aphis gossypii TaxID=80765 RepID=A0A9P0IN26_APHGO|nr:uncharacterized protein LOC114129617 [Aphis gossypii]CAH1711826.1 unnamed protein product [Aphis gossypii]
MKTNNKNDDKDNTIYNRDFKWPKKSKQVIINKAPTCTLCTNKGQEKNKSIATEEYEKKIKDFQALFDRFPYLKDVICKMSTDEIDNLVKEKNTTVYDSDYNKPKYQGYTNCAKENYEAVDDDDEPFKHDVRIRLKKPHVQRSGVKYSGISPPEPYVVPISEYRSTIHSLGTRIIKEQLMVPKTT